MADVMDGALDLSKPSGVSGVTGVQTTSPVPSLSPEPPSHRSVGGEGGEGERSESVSSDGHDTDGSTTTRTHPIAGPFIAGSVMPTVIAPPPTSPGSPGETTEGEPGSSPPLPAGLNGEAGGPRPFKMYPFEAMPGMYSQLAAAQAAGGAGLNPAALGGLGAGMAPGLMNPFAAAGGSPLPFGGLLDSAITLSSPIGQYLAQRKRRAEAASSKGGSTSGQRSPGSKSNGSFDGFDNGTSSEDFKANMMKMEGGSSSLSPHSVMDNPSANTAGENDGQSPSSKRSKLSTGSSMEDSKDSSYWERRRKNNEAAKRSRDSRRAKEEEIALRAAFLEQENLKLRAQVAILKNETAKLHYMLYQRV